MDKEDGHILSFLVVLMLLMTLLATGSMALAKRELALSGLDRQSANSYHLARSAAEKVVDMVNKEIAIELPRLMKEASEKTHAQLLESSLNYECTRGGIIDPYAGKYSLAGYENQYKMILKNLIYAHTAKEFMGNSKLSGSYGAYSDGRDDIPLIITVKLYNKSSPNIPDDLKKTIRNLGPDDFAIEAEAWARENAHTSLSKTRVVGSFGLPQILEDDELLEAYSWDDQAGNEVQVGPEDIDPAVFQDQHQWSYNNPLEVITGSTIVDLSRFGLHPTAIVCTDPEATMILQGGNVFNGLIISLGSLSLPDEITINGWVIAPDQTTASSIRINHDKDMALKIPFMDKVLQRRLLDCLGLTNYQGLAHSVAKGQVEGAIDLIFGEDDKRKLKISQASIINSQTGGLNFVMKSLARLQ